jgi:hypothetical protein
MSKEIKPNFDSLQNPETIIDEVAKVTHEVDQVSILKTVLDNLEIKATDEIEPPKVAWEQINGTETAILGTLGNFSLIIGKAKSRKSFYVNIAISTIVQNDLLMNQFRGCLSDDKKTVLYFDTEQGKYHVQLALKRICTQIGISEPTNLKTYHLRSKAPAERLALIEHAINTTPNVGFVVIDGIKDLVTSINDEEQATMIATKLLKWTEEKEIHILTVLHQNKNDKNARGHLGSELVNKAETVLSITKDETDNNISIVEAEYCRGQEPKPFAFEIIDGLPQIAKNFAIRTESKKKKFNIDELDQDALWKTITNVFENGESFTYSEIQIQLKLAYERMFQNSIGINRIKEIIVHSRINGWLIQSKSKAPYQIGVFQEDENS